MTRSWTVALPILLFAACGGRVDLAPSNGVDTSPDSGAPVSTASGGSLTGSFHGRSFDVHDVVAIQTNERDSSGELVSQLLVSFTDSANLCGDLQSGFERPGSRFMNVLIVQRSTSQMPVLTPGTYSASTEEQRLPSGDTLFASGGIVSMDSHCRNKDLDGNVATSGTITITAVEAARVAGSFAVTFPSGDRFSGTFDAPQCTVASAKTQPSCG